MEVIKRNGSRVGFDPHKIEVAILKAFAETRSERTETLTECCKENRRRDWIDWQGYVCRGIFRISSEKKLMATKV